VVVPLERHEARAGDRAGHQPTLRERHHRVVARMQHECGHVESGGEAEDVELAARLPDPDRRLR
jgi:hypothetical protein